jgi:UDP-glucose 4-epimerase
MTHLVVGRGQLGSAVAAHLPGADVRFVDVPWADNARACDALSGQIRQFLEDPAADSILWCAGAGVVGTWSSALQDEQHIFQHALEVIRRSPRPPRKLFVASSAGGVYGANRGVCDESTPPIPANAYGRSKLDQESTVAEWAAGTEVSVLVGRISNLFGPRQNLAKPQGFISHLLLATVQQRPLVFTVPGSTIRDFAFADDVGHHIALWASAPNSEPGTVVKILASERSVSLAHVAAMTSRITRRPARVLFARSRASDQPAMTRFVSRVQIPSTANARFRTLEHGLWLTWIALMRRGNAGR